MDKMTPPEIEQALRNTPDWTETGGQIHRTYQFKDFVESMKFVTKVAEQAEADQHHPDILIRWNKVTLSLSTHDAGGITDKDFALAAKADKFAQQCMPKAGAPSATPPTAAQGTRVPSKRTK